MTAFEELLLPQPFDAPPPPSPSPAAEGDSLWLACQQVLIRPYTPRDRSAVIGIINAVGHERRYLQTDRYIPTPAWELALSQEPLAPPWFLFALEQHRRLIGFARVFPEPAACTGVPQPGWAGNVGIALLPPFRSQGIGTQTLRRLVDRARQQGCAHLTADILASNHRSIRLFAGQGFREMLRRQRSLAYLQKPVEELVMSLLLT